MCQHVSKLIVGGIASLLLAAQAAAQSTAPDQQLAQLHACYNKLSDEVGSDVASRQQIILLQDEVKRLQAHIADLDKQIHATSRPNKEHP